MAVGGSVSSFGLVLLLLFGGGFVGSSDVVPLPADPVVAQIAPEQCLLYSSWTGKTEVALGATSSTERLFSDPEFVDYLDHVDEVVRQFFSQGAKAQEVTEKQVEGVFHLLDHLRTHAGSFYLAEMIPNGKFPEILGGLVIRVDDDESEQLVEFIDVLLKPIVGKSQTEVEIGDYQFSRIEFGARMPPFTWGIKGNYWILGLGEGEAERIVERLEGSVPDWLVAAQKTVNTPRPATFFHLNIKRAFSTIHDFLELGDLVNFVGVLEAFGFDSIESFSYGGGLDEQGTVGRGLLKLSGKLSGMMTLLDCGPLVAADFERISSESPVALVFQFNPADAMNALLEFCEHEKAPEEAVQMSEFWQQRFNVIQQVFGLDIRNDFIGSIGDTWRVFVQPGPGALMGGWTLSVDLTDSEKFTKAHSLWLNILERNQPQFASEEEYEGITLYSAPAAGLPVVPAWCIHDDRLIVCTSVESLKRMVAGDAPEKTLAEAKQVRPFLEDGKQTFKLLQIDMMAVMKVALPFVAQQLNILPAGSPIDASILPPMEILSKYMRPTVIAVERTAAGVEMTHRSTLPGLNLGQAIPLLVGANMPAPQGARGPAHRVQSINNLKQIGLAMMNFHDVRGAFPAGYNADKEGKPLLSWRVHILPFLDQQALYKEFHLDEPWDSPHNKRLIAEMPIIYQSPQSNAEKGKTTYLGVGGADGIFVRPEGEDTGGTGIREITDGTSNTILTVEVTDQRAIVWSRPGDFAPQAKDPQQGLRVDPQQGMMFGFADGSVRRLPKRTAKETLMSYFTKAGGEVIEQP